MKQSAQKCEEMQQLLVCYSPPLASDVLMSLGLDKEYLPLDVLSQQYTIFLHMDTLSA